MSEHEKCGWCGGEPHRDCDDNDAAVISCYDCGQTQWLKSWDNCQRIIRLGRELDEAIERGRKLHPWVSQEYQEQALRDEIYELFSEAFEGYEITQRKDIDIKRVVAEAVDTLVCAKRAEEGR